MDLIKIINHLRCFRRHLSVFAFFISRTFIHLKCYVCLQYEHGLAPGDGIHWTGQRGQVRDTWQIAAQPCSEAGSFSL